LHKGGLVGTLPSSISQMSELTTLVAYINRLSGPIPTEMSTMKKLTFLQMSGNQFSGLLPALPFSQYTSCGLSSGQAFLCPLPPGADSCHVDSCHGTGTNPPTPTLAPTSPGRSSLAAGLGVGAACAIAAAAFCRYREKQRKQPPHSKQEETEMALSLNDPSDL
jgi:hypothetical protein